MNETAALSIRLSALLLGQNGQGGGNPLTGLLGSFWFPMIIVFVLFYFLLLRPENRKRAEMSRMLDSLKKNDRVVTIGGVYGVVINAPKGAAEITIRVDESSNAKLRVEQSTIKRVISDEDGEETKES